MQQQYPFKKIEQEAQQYWETNQTFAASETSDKPKYYCLSMFPYPSGRLPAGEALAIEPESFKTDVERGQV